MPPRPGRDPDRTPRRGDRLADRLASVPVWALTMPLVVLAGSALLGNALAPALLANQPLLLLGLNATTRHLLLTSTTVDLFPWFALALLRRSLENPFLYLLGWRFGDDAVRWVTDRTGGAAAAARARRGFRRWGWLAVAVFPGGVVCVLAGASGMGLATFAALSLVGTVGTLVVLRASGGALAGPVEAVVTVTTEGWVWLTALSVALAVGWLVVSRRRRRGVGGGGGGVSPG